MVKVRRLYIENFIILKTIMGKDKLEINFSDNPLCIIIGKNGSGKSFLMSLITPSPVDLVKNRSNNPSLPDKIGVKELDLELDNKYLYKIKIVYDSKTSCFIHKYNRYTDEDLGELNPNGNVSSYYDVLDRELGFTKSYINIGYLSSSVTNLIAMKPTERSSYISIWLPQLSEFIDANKVVSKKANILKRQIDMLNNEIGKLSDTDYDILIKNYDANILELENNYHEDLKDQSKAQAYLKLINPISRDELENKISSFKNKVRLLGQERNEIMDTQLLLAQYSGKEGKKRLQDNLKECNSNLTKLSEQIKNIDNNLNNIETELNEINSSDKDVDENAYLSIESLINTLRGEINNLNSLRDSNLKDHPEYVQIENISKSDIDVFKLFIEDLSNIRNKVTSLVDSSYLKDNEFISSSNDKIIKLKETYEKNLENIENEIMTSSNKIYLLKNSDMSYIMKFRPKDCTRTCGIVNELMKYIDPTTEINIVQKKLNELISEKTELEEKINKIKEESRNMALALDYINDMNNKIFNKKDLISIMPEYIRDNFNNPDIGSLISNIPRLYDKIDDYKEYIYLIDKINITKQSLDNSLINFDLMKQKRNINSKWIKLREKFENTRIERQRIIDEFNKNETIEKRLKSLSELSEQNVKQIEDYNERADILLNEKKTLKDIAKNYYVYNSLKESDRKLEIRLYETKNNLDDIKSKLEAIKNKKNSMITLVENRDNLLEKKKKYDILAEVWSPKTGYPALQMEDWLDDLTVQTNNDLEKMWGSELKIETFEIGANEFNISINKNGSIIKDASECSDGEKSTLSLAISFAVIEINLKYRKYNVLRFDELDGPFDADRRRTFIEVLNNRLTDLDCGSAFIISHNNEFGDVPADAIILSETEEKLEMINKNIVYNKD